MTSEYGEHYSVMLRECLEYLDVNKDKEFRRFADLTFGAGGHTLEISQLDKCHVISTDQDQDAIKNGLELIENKNVTNVELLNTNFEKFPDIMEERGIKFDGIMMDLGVSSHQFDTGERGFSFRFDGPLDMRMDQKNNPLTAEELINDYDAESLEEILYKYGEEKFAKNIVKNICIKREEKRITTTKELEDIIFHSYPKKLRHGRLHPSTKTFQAFRIFVNNELRVLEIILPRLIDLLEVGGRLIVISFHSLEDRIAKHTFKSFSQKDKKIVRIITKRPLTAQEDELAVNSRSRSAKLRVVEKL